MNTERKLYTPVVSPSRIADGNMYEFEFLFRTYYRRLCIYAERLVGNRGDSEDIVSDMFTMLWKNRANLREVVSLEGYMVTSVYRLCINHLKHLQVESRYAERASRMLHEAELFHSADDPLSELITKEECTSLEHAIAELPDQCRKIFELNKLEGLSYEEVSARLSISINTVRTQLTRGMRKLRERLT